jgi:hypothetical protein
VRPIVDQSIIWRANVPRLAIGANRGFVFDHDFAHGRVWLHARFPCQIKIFACNKTCSLIVFLAMTVPFTDHTPVSMFFIAAFTSGSRFSWPDPGGLFCGFPKTPGGFAKRESAAIAQIELVLRGMIFFIFPFLIRSAAEAWIALAWNDLFLRRNFLLRRGLLIRRRKK